MFYKTERKTHPSFLRGWVVHNGEANWVYEGECETREIALARIDKHFEGNTTKQKIEFEYISR